jgi:hypothetical protein
MRTVHAAADLAFGRDQHEQLRHTPSSSLWLVSMLVARSLACWHGCVMLCCERHACGARMVAVQVSCCKGVKVAMVCG